MSPDNVIDIFRHATSHIVVMVCVLILPGLLVGLLIAMFQAATQINEQTLSFVPRLIVTFVALMMTGPWLLRMISEYTEQLFEQIPMMIG